MADTERRPTIGTGEAAEQVGYSRRALIKWAAQGKITPDHQTPGGHLRWNLDDLRQQLARLEQPGDE